MNYVIVSILVLSTVQLAYLMYNRGITENGVFYEMYSSTGPQNEQVLITILKQLYNPYYAQQQYPDNNSRHYMKISYDTDEEYDYEDEEEREHSNKFTPPHFSPNFSRILKNYQTTQRYNENWMDNLFYSQINKH
ncbi:hypothetical protein FQR65_LT04758 [Abscondita terminalis]|nr:hypothetical protein FQR65_LT04758 [Abscondita terminalis]